MLSQQQPQLSTEPGAHRTDAHNTLFPPSLAHTARTHSARRQLQKIVNPYHEVALGKHAVSRVLPRPLDRGFTHDYHWHDVLTTILGGVDADQSHGAVRQFGLHALRQLLQCAFLVAEIIVGANPPGELRWFCYDALADDRAHAVSVGEAFMAAGMEAGTYIATQQIRGLNISGE